MTTAVSYNSHTGYYGLRVQETLDSVLSGKEGEGRVLQPPNRFAQWYANSPYRAYMLDAAKKLNDHERALLNYRDSGGELPEPAAADTPSAAAQDETFRRIEEHHEAMDEQAAVHMAKDLMRQDRAAQTAQTRKKQLRETFQPNLMEGTIEAHHHELEAAGVHHYMPLVKSYPAQIRYQEPTPQYAATGQPQANEFPTFEELNLNQKRVGVPVLTQEQAMTYEHARRFVVEPTWSS